MWKIAWKTGRSQ